MTQRIDLLLSSEATFRELYTYIYNYCFHQQINAPTHLSVHTHTLSLMDIVVSTAKLNGCKIYSHSCTHPQCIQNTQCIQYYKHTHTQTSDGGSSCFITKPTHSKGDQANTVRSILTNVLINKVFIDMVIITRIFFN